MVAANHIQILPELEAWFRNLNEAEALQLEENLKRDGLLDSLKWAEITLDDGSVVEAIVDGHQRWMACQRLGISILDANWQLIKEVTTIRQARKWMYDFQAGRRNWSPNEIALMAAQEYEDDKILSGERTDLFGKGKTDTAEIVGKRFGKTGRWVREAVQFAKALDELKATIGIDAQVELLRDSPAINRDTVISLAQAPEHVQREAWELVLKRNTKGIPGILERAKRLVEGTGAKPVPGQKSTADRFDLAELIYLIDKWSEDMVRAYNPTTDVRAASYLSSHLASALSKVIILAEVNGFGMDVLDAYVAKRVAAAAAAAKEPETKDDLGEDLSQASEPEAEPAKEPKATPAKKSRKDEVRVKLSKANP